MIRDKLKGKIRKAALRFFDMEWEAQDRKTTRDAGVVGDVDTSVIPKIVDGDGDTPGPKHKRLIGRTWLAAQLISDEGGFIVDLRPPAEFAAGHLKGAVSMPGDQIRDRLDELPEQTIRVTLVDAVGSPEAEEMARWLRDEKGWSWARSLQGGFAEWLEHGEQVFTPEKPEGARWAIGDSVKVDDGREGVVQGHRTVGPALAYDVLLADGEVALGLGEKALS